MAETWRKRRPPPWFGPVLNNPRSLEAMTTAMIRSMEATAESYWLYLGRFMRDHALFGDEICYQRRDDCRKVLRAIRAERELRDKAIAVEKALVASIDKTA